MKALLIQIRREFWEHRALWMAPLAIAIVLLLAAAAFGHIRLEVGDTRARENGGTLPPLFELMLLGWAVPFYLAAAILAAAYLLDCLYAERRDRSILFWRSMPASDARTVLVKLLVGLVIVPLGTYGFAAASSLLASAILVLRNHGPVINGMSVSPWNTLAWLRMQGTMLYGLIAALFWYAPFAAYLMLISVWARRSPYAWAFIPPALLVIFEHMVFGTDYIGRIVDGGFTELLHLAYRVDARSAVVIGNFISPPDSGGGQLSLTTQLLDPLHLLASQRLWWGLLAATLMIAVAIRRRRFGDES
jgi:ABC-2 type transport system permease protein